MSTNSSFEGFLPNDKNRLQQLGRVALVVGRVLANGFLASGRSLGMAGPNLAAASFREPSPRTNVWDQVPRTQEPTQNTATYSSDLEHEAVVPVQHVLTPEQEAQIKEFREELRTFKGLPE